MNKLLIGLSALVLVACAQDKDYVVNPKNPNEITITNPNSNLAMFIDFAAAVQHQAIVDKCPKQIAYGNPQEQREKYQRARIFLPEKTQKIYDDSVKMYSKTSCAEIIKERITGKNYKFLRAL
jgi:hypothetical protein